MASLGVFLSCDHVAAPASGPVAIPSTIIFADDNRLCTIEADGTHLRVIATGVGSFDWQARLSPDASQIVYRIFSAYTPSQIQLYDRRTDTTHSLTADTLYHEAPTFSPDGKDVLFLTRHGWMQSLFVKQLASGTVRQLTVGRNCYNPIYSSDGAQIMFYFNNAWYDRGIGIMDRDGSHLRILEPGHNPIFFPTGDKILFQYPVSANDLGLFTMAIDGSNHVFLATIPPQTYPSLSPDGRHIVFAHHSTNYEIVLMRADGSDRVNLTDDRAAEFWPNFSRDGARIVFATWDSTRTSAVELMTLDGRNRTRIYETTGYLRQPTF